MSYVPTMTFDSYHELGCIGSIRALPENETAALLAHLDAVTDERVAAVKHPWYYKAYLLFTWMDQLVRDPRILDHVERIVGPDILVMSAMSGARYRERAATSPGPGMPAIGASKPRDIVTAWFALTESNDENGCMQLALGIHRLDLVDHENTYAPDNILSHGQTVKIDLKNWITVNDILKSGEMLLYRALLAHGSGPNTTTRPRVGMCIRYLAGTIRYTVGPPVLAMLVRGRHTGNLSLEDPPESDLSPDAIAQHTRLLEPHAATRYVNL